MEYERSVADGDPLGRRPDWVGGGLIRSAGGWSQVLPLRQQGEKETYAERIPGGGDFIQAVLEESDRKLARQIHTRKKTGSLAQFIKEQCREADVIARWP